MRGLSVREPHVRAFASVSVDYTRVNKTIRSTMCYADLNVDGTVGYCLVNKSWLRETTLVSFLIAAQPSIGVNLARFTSVLARSIGLEDIRIRTSLAGRISIASLAMRGTLCASLLCVVLPVASGAWLFDALRVVGARFLPQVERVHALLTVRGRGVPGIGAHFTIS